MTDWELKQQQKQQTIATAAREILRYLQGYILDPMTDYTDRVKITMIGKPDCGFSMRLYNEHGEPRASIYGLWPSPESHETFVPRHAPSITLALDKGWRRIAADIRRRFLDEYLPAFEEQEEYKRAYIANQELKTEIALELAELGGADSRVSEWQGTDRPKVYGYSRESGPYYGFTAEVHGRYQDNRPQGAKVDLEIRGMDPEFAKMICYYLGQARG